MTTCTPAWGQHLGIFPLGLPRTQGHSLVELSDRELIRETASRYANAYDERRLDLLEAVFTNDAVMTLYVAGERINVTRGRADIVTSLDQTMQSQTDQRRHVISNALIEHYSSEVSLLTSCVTIISAEVEATVVSSGFYTFAMQLHSGIWQIKDLSVCLDVPF